MGYTLSRTEGDLTLTVGYSGNNADGRARYVVVLRKNGESTAVFESASLELPWRDDRRALVDAAGFLAYYAGTDEDDVPDSLAGVSAGQVVALQPFADTLAPMESDLLDEA